MNDQFVNFILTPSGFMTLGLTITFAILLGVLVVAQKRGKLDWRDLITRSGSNKVSLSKLLQLVGGITATWVIVKTTVSQTGISWELFTAYLAYVGSVEAYSKFVMARYTLPNSRTPAPSYQTNFEQEELSDDVDVDELVKPKKNTNRPSGAAKAM